MRLGRTAWRRLRRRLRAYRRLQRQLAELRQAHERLGYEAARLRDRQERHRRVLEFTTRLLPLLGISIEEFIQAVIAPQ